MDVWSVLLNNDTELWGVGDYDKKKQVCNIETKVINSKDFTESFTIEFGKFKSFSSTMSLKWANTQIDIVICLLYTSPSPRDRTRSRMPSSA